MGSRRAHLEYGWSPYRPGRYRRLLRGHQEHGLVLGRGSALRSPQHESTVAGLNGTSTLLIYTYINIYMYITHHLSPITGEPVP